MNLKRFKMVLARIEKHPEWWDQTMFYDLSKPWDCGTHCCIAGHANYMARQKKFKGVINPHNGTKVYALEDTARTYLELNYDEQHWLFHMNRTLQDFRAVAETGRIPS